MTIRVGELSAEERAELTRMARSRTLCAGRVKRAQLVLLAVEGHKAEVIAATLRLHARTARFQLKRFNAHGLAGLEESERSGRPPTHSAEQASAVIEAALTTRPVDLGLPFASWTLDRLVAYLSETKSIAMRRSRIGEILAREGLKWRQEETWFGVRIDPEFARKRGRSSGSTPSRPKAASSFASTRWARRPARATPAANSSGPTRPKPSGPSRRSTTAGAGRPAPSSAPSNRPQAPR